jgi:hypothetical protein
MFEDGEPAFEVMDLASETLDLSIARVRCRSCRSPARSDGVFIIPSMRSLRWHGRRDVFGAGP